jgi:hypothetical protein
MMDAKTKAVAYYTALGNKNIETVKEYIHPNIEFTDPQEKLVGKEAFLKAAKGFSAIFKTLTIQAKFGSENQAVIVYDLDIPSLAKHLRAVSLLSFEDGLISKIELIYDTRCLMEKQEEIPSNK